MNAVNAYKKLGKNICLGAAIPEDPVSAKQFWCGGNCPEAVSLFLHFYFELVALREYR